jgi:hypothetical protein
MWNTGKTYTSKITGAHVGPTRAVVALATKDFVNKLSLLVYISILCIRFLAVCCININEKYNNINGDLMNLCLFSNCA